MVPFFRAPFTYGFKYLNLRITFQGNENSRQPGDMFVGACINTYHTYQWSSCSSILRLRLRVFDILMRACSRLFCQVLAGWESNPAHWIER